MKTFSSALARVLTRAVPASPARSIITIAMAIGLRFRWASVNVTRICKRINPLHCVVLGYASYIALGMFVLCLPISHKTDNVRIIDALFTATSAVSTTGLVTVSTGDDFNFLGQFTILTLIQFGGLGYMTIGSFIVMAMSGKMSSTRRNISVLAMGLPAGFDVRGFIRKVVVFTFAIEALGAAGLYLVFENHGTPQPLWNAVFHSVSAFCTAGFGIHNDSFESYRSDVALNFILIALSYAGAIGFIVMNDVWEMLRGKRNAITLTSRVIVISTLVISLLGTVLFAIDEPSIRDLPIGQRWLAAWFQVMTASTTVGFNTISIGSLSASSVFLLTLVMMIGASPAGTGGGIKTTSVTALWAVLSSIIRRSNEITFAKKQIPEPRIRAAVANVTFYCMVLGTGIYTLALSESAPLPDLIFEAASALGTVGLSRGITASMTDLGKLILVAMMFFGRVGPVTLAMALQQTRAPKPQPQTTPAACEDVAI